MRPTGVTLSALFQFFRGALVALFALGIFFVGGMASRLASLAAEGNMLQRFIAGFGHFVGVALLIYAAAPDRIGNWPAASPELGASSHHRIFCARHPDSSAPDSSSPARLHALYSA